MRRVLLGAACGTGSSTARSFASIIIPAFGKDLVDTIRVFGLVACNRSGVPGEQPEKPSLKVAMIIPIKPWDRKAGLEAWRKRMADKYLGLTHDPHRPCKPAHKKS